MAEWDKLFTYDNGDLVWKIKPSKKIKAGSVAGTDDRGYVSIIYRGKRSRAHRIIWEMHNGAIPDGMQIDHINRVRTDNRIENLRLVTSQQNNFNRSGVKGFCYDVRSGKFRAQIVIDHKFKHLGHYDTILDARAAYLRARKELFGEFA